MLWLYHTYGGGCTIVLYVKHVVLIQFVRKHTDHLGININTKPLITFRDKVVHDKDNASYESTAISIFSLHRQTSCGSITMIHPHQIMMQWAGSPQALLVVHVLHQHSVVSGTTAGACCCCIMRKKSKLRTNTKNIREDRAFDCTLRPASASS